MTVENYNYLVKIVKNFEKCFAIQKIVLPLHRFRRDGRVVDYSGLENRRTERYRGFESLSLRQHIKSSHIANFFVFGSERGIIYYSALGDKTK